jgi:phosphinothricin acetyltransferase
MIRLAIPSDAARLLEIYAPIIETTAITFETVVPSVADFAKRIEKISSVYPYLVWEEGSEILGYATRFRDRAAYDWICESAIYIHESARGKGIGKKLYSKLFDCLRAQGLVSVIGGIRSGSTSAKLHESLGFRNVGNIPYAGYKLNAWHDVEFWQLVLQQPVPQKPKPVIPFPQLADTINLNA